MTVEIYKLGDRGFHGYGQPFKDSYGATLSVYESSAATGPHVWVNIKGIDNNDGTAHLNEEQAKALIERLQAWVDEIPTRWTNLPAQNSGTEQMNTEES